MTPERIAELRGVVQSLTAGIVEHPRSHAEDYAEMLDEIERLTALVALDEYLRLDDADLQSCDWGRCNGEAVVLRWSAECNGYPSVCREHLAGEHPQ